MPLGVNTTTNTITISNHGYSSGDKVIHSSTTPCQGLENDEIYYVVKVDENNFKLADTYYNSTQLKPTTVGIASTSFGEFGLVNPSVTAYRSSSLVFDLSDSSLAFTQQFTSILHLGLISIWMKIILRPGKLMDLLQDLVLLEMENLDCLQSLR